MNKRGHATILPRILVRKKKLEIRIKKKKGNAIKHLTCKEPDSSPHLIIQFLLEKLIFV